jgi:hypothetical protein
VIVRATHLNLLGFARLGNARYAFNCTECGSPMGAGSLWVRMRGFLSVMCWRCFIEVLS